MPTSRAKNSGIIYGDGSFELAASAGSDVSVQVYGYRKEINGTLTFVIGGAYKQGGYYLKFSGSEATGFAIETLPIPAAYPLKVVSTILG
ncbi:unnamed protein product [Hermetia illucens]|uniref:Uncharacterized protein n=2 Tax=Hermetia illucens TaxID=343691 RepID=A0A7R8YTE3_HERIL|nr:unnamed protein product [Hermetia illucens]